MPILAPNGGDGLSGEIEAPRSRDCPVTQGTLSPVSPLAYGTKVHKAYGASAFPFLNKSLSAVGSHSTLSAVGQGALGDRVPRKIEMFYPL